MVDLVNGFTDSRFALGSDLSSEVAATARSIHAARNAKTDAPVLFTTIAFNEDLADAGIWPQKCSGLQELLTSWCVIAGGHALLVEGTVDRSVLAHPLFTGVS
ncbi:hypothetical protein ACFXKG_29475, partial [Streptomyces sp. NPDC059255]